jgi:NTE family protein
MAETAAPGAQPEGRPRVGLVLSGGGARGAAHVGVLRVLEDMRIPVDYVAGTSMGAIIGGLYASGLSADEIAVAVEQMDWEKMFNDDLDRADRSFRRKRDDDLLLVKAQAGYDYSTGEFKLPLGLVEGQRITLAVRALTTRVTGVNDFDQLPTPFRAVATDIGNGKVAVLGHGDLALAITASMAVPGVFAPTLVDGRLLVDGGITDNLPMDVARDMGADILIVVDISTPLHPTEDLTDVLVLTDQLTSIMTRANTERNLATVTEGDIVIVPDLGDITGADFARTGEAMYTGFRAADGVRDRLAALSVSAEQYRQWISRRQANTAPLPVIDFIDVHTDADLDPRILRDKIEHPTGQPLEVGQINRDMGSLYGMELFEKVNYEVVHLDGRTGLEVDARAKRWGPDYLQFGLELEDDFEGDTLFNLRVAYLRTAMNSLGAEWRTVLTVGEEPGLFTGWYQPLDQDQRYFVHPVAFGNKRNVNVYDGGERIAVYRVTEYGLRLGLGRELGAWGEIRVGIERSQVSSSLRVGDPSGLEEAYADGNLFVRFEVDELDDVNFPREGHYLQTDYEWHRNELGDEGHFDQFTYGLGFAVTRGRYTVIPSFSGGATINGDAPISRLFPLGGFLRLSGLERNELTGEEFLLGRAVVYRRMNDFRYLPVYVGGSAEYGSIGDESDLSDGRAAASLFLGIDSPLGPFYAGGGWSEGGHYTGFLFLGRRF